MNESYTQVHKAIIDEACHKYLRDRGIRIDIKTEELINYQLNRRWFKAKDRACARARMVEEIQMLSWRGGFWARKAEALILLCALSASETVSLSASDAEFVGLIPRV